MNQAFKNINIEEILFFDLELVRKSKELDINSKEFELYQKKIRDRATDGLPTSEETIEHYKKFAALKMGYNRIVCATVGKVVEGILYLRSFIGTEEEILRGLYSKFQTSKYISGFNILEYDTPMARVNSLQYEGVSELIPESHNDSNKKIWDMKTTLDLMGVFKGTHWANPSLDEVCYHLGIKSPKEGDIEGSQVSEVYYEEGISKIEPYCKRDVFAVVNLFCRLQGKPLFESYVDANEAEGDMPQEESLPILTKLYNTKQLNKEELISYLKGRGLKKSTPKKEKETVKNLILAHYCEKIEVTAMNKRELEAINKTRTGEVEELFKTL